VVIDSVVCVAQWLLLRAERRRRIAAEREVAEQAAVMQLMARDLVVSGAVRVTRETRHRGVVS